MFLREFISFTLYLSDLIEVLKLFNCDGAVGCSIGWIYSRKSVLQGVYLATDYVWVRYNVNTFTIEPVFCVLGFVVSGFFFAIFSPNIFIINGSFLNYADLQYRGKTTEVQITVSQHRWCADITLIPLYSTYPSDALYHNQIEKMA